MKAKASCIILVHIFVLVLVARVAIVDSKEKVESDKVWKLTYQNIVAPTSATAVEAVAVLNDIEKETGGRVTFPKRFNSSALVPASRALPALAEGTFHFFSTSALFHAGVNPLFGFLETPGLATRAEAREKMLEDPQIMEILQKAWNGIGIQLFGYLATAEQVYSFSKTKKIKSLDDMKGLRIVGSGGAFNELVKALGASTVMTPPGQRYESMMRGVGDGLACTIRMFEDYKLGETVAQVVLPPWHVLQAQPWLASKKTWDSFPEDIKAIITRVANKHLKRTISIYETKYVKKINPAVIKKYNLEVLQLSKEDIRKLHKACEEVINKFGKKSPEAKQLVDIWQAKYRPKDF